MLTCSAQVLAPLRLRPASVDFGKMSREPTAHKRTITISRGDGGPITPSVVAARGKGISAEIREIEPQTRYELDVTVSPPWPNGPVRGSIVLTTGVSQSPQTTVPVVAKLKGRLESSPSAFRVVTGRATGAWMAATLNWSGEPHGHALEVSCNEPNLTVSLQENSGKQQVVLQVPASYEPEQRRSVITVRTDDKEVPILRIPVTCGPQSKRVIGTKKASPKSTAR